MSTVPPNHPKPPPAAQLAGRPSTRSLLRWGALVLAVHLGVLLSLAGTLDWQLSSPQTLRTGPMQTRTIADSSADSTLSGLHPAPAARTRVALIEKPRPAPSPKADTPQSAAAPQKPQAFAVAGTTLPTEADSALKTAPDLATDPSPAEPAILTAPDPLPPPDASPNQTNPITEKNLATATAPQAPGILVSEAPVPRVPAESRLTDASTDAAPSTPNPTPRPATSEPVTRSAATPDSPSTTTPEPTHHSAEASAPSPQHSPAPTNAAPQAGAAAPQRIASATLALPELTLASLPPSALLSYRLQGQEKGINYQASGELRWQRNDSAYAMSLSVKAFLLGSRHWRSVGQINTTGLAPTRFSDSWRSERATHFDRPNQRIVFSSNAPTVPLQPGAQDQVSLYVQLAAAMAQSGGRWQPGTRLQIQTATVRDALPWLLTLEKQETLQVEGQSLQAFKWVCQPRNRFDAQVEFWVSAAHDWLPARIRITQASGSFIDLQLTGRETLADLPPVQ